MPGENFNSVQFVQIVQAELRAAAARLVMPEYMTTSDASNGNYASLLVAEGPPYKNFLRVQTTYRRIFTPIVQEILERGVEAGKLPKEAVELLKLKAVPPIITTHEPLANSQNKQILLSNGIISRSTWQRERGYDPKAENAEIQAEAANDPTMQDVDGGGTNA
jgi:hypothetical protein